MISVIICSRGGNYSDAVVSNIDLGIGVPYEIIIIDNSSNELGICAAYNKGASESKYDLLCFAHEDILINTLDWGSVVNKILKDQSIGVLGIAGGKFLLKAPSSWWGCGKKYLSINIIDENKVSEKDFKRITYSNPEKQSLVDVAAVDGVWMCMRKEVWAKSPFDSINFPDFHFYDIDFCASLFHDYRICVTFDVELTHFSRGNFNASFFKNANNFYNKHRSNLPMGGHLVSKQELRNASYKSCAQFLLEIIARKIDYRIGIKYMFECMRLMPFNRDTFWLLRKYLVYSISWAS